MKLTLQIPVRKRMVTGSSYTFDTGLRECDVTAVSRSRANRHGTAWHYYAHVRHPDIHPDYPTSHTGEVLQWIRRADHPGWMPPAFKPGQHIVILKEDKPC